MYIYSFYPLLSLLIDDRAQIMERVLCADSHHAAVATAITCTAAALVLRGTAKQMLMGSLQNTEHFWKNKLMSIFSPDQIQMLISIHAYTRRFRRELHG